MYKDEKLFYCLFTIFIVGFVVTMFGMLFTKSDFFIWTAMFMAIIGLMLINIPYDEQRDRDKLINQGL